MGNNKATSLIFFVMVALFANAQNQDTVWQHVKIQPWLFNTSDHEFSPVLTDQGLVYVSFKQKSKKDKPNRGEQQFDIRLVKNESEQSVLFSESIQSDFIEGPFAFNQNKMYLTRSNISQSKKNVSQDRTIKMKLFETENIDGVWSQPQRIEFLAGDFNFCHPTLNTRGDMMIFASDMTGGFGGMDLYVSYKLNDVWSRPYNLGPEINTSGNDCFPFFYNDQMLFFSSDGETLGGDLNIYQVPFLQDEFRGVRKLPAPINSERDDFSLSVSKDGKQIWFSSNRPGKGKDDLFYIDLIESLEYDVPKEDINFSIQLIDEIDQSPIPFSEISISPLDLALIDLDEYDEQEVLKRALDPDLMSFKIKTDKKGEQIFSVDPETKLIIRIAIPDYKESRFVYDPQNDSPEWVISLTPLDNNKKTSVTESVEPKKLVIPTAKGSKVIFDNIYYEYNSAVIKKEAAGELDALYDSLIANPLMKIQLTSHSDSRGEDLYNLKLSQQRANSAKQYLVDRGISAKRIRAVGVGESEIRNHCSNGITCSDMEHKFNRRTELEVLDN